MADPICQWLPTEGLCTRIDETTGYRDSVFLEAHIIVLEVLVSGKYSAESMLTGSGGGGMCGNGVGEFDVPL